jgi:hypothetical protein
MFLLIIGPLFEQVIFRYAQIRWRHLQHDNLRTARFSETPSNHTLPDDRKPRP